ncbi:Uncharacterized protein Rs2_26561 [Raphanus sativus]|nr:Uncharacterized protein Rs2_26561 [Raphanus sativus]
MKLKLNLNLSSLLLLKIWFYVYGSFLQEVTKKVGGNYSKILRGERITNVAFHRYLYHGRSDSLAAAARQPSLQLYGVCFLVGNSECTVHGFDAYTLMRHVQVLVKLGQTNVTEIVQCRQFMSVKERCNMVGS